MGSRLRLIVSASAMALILPVITAARAGAQNNFSKVNLAPDKKVYHDESTCTEGNNIESYYKKNGTDNRPKCVHCKRISGMSR